MKSIIAELWYGNISPHDEITENNSYLKHLLDLLKQNRNILSETLTEAQKETLEKYDDCINEMKDITEREAFRYGLSIGLKMIAEVTYNIQEKEE